MKIYVVCEKGHKIYLSSRVRKQRDLPLYIEVRCPLCGHLGVYSRNRVKAEAEVGATLGGTVLGGLIGLLGGPLGVIIGGTGGGLLGANADAEEERRVREFYEN
jgi:uncharacterized protein YcfJ